MQVIHEIKDEAPAYRHRLSSPNAGTGLWVSYQMPAVLETRNGVYVAVTDYWKGIQPFPVPGKIYLVKEKT